MTNPELLAQFTWLQRDPAEILGDSRPRTLDELMKKKPLWQEIYRDWLQNYNSGLVDGWSYLLDSLGKVGDYTRWLTDAYKNFYKDAGNLKDAVRKNAAQALQTYPWAPADTAALLGNARPKNFDELTEEGASGQWVGAFRGWLENKAPFPNADAWLDWVLGQGEIAERWAAELEPTIRVFAGDIGQLKDKLGEQYGTSGQRRGQRVMDALDEGLVNVAERSVREAAAERFMAQRAAAGQPGAPAAATPAAAATAAAAKTPAPATTSAPAATAAAATTPAAGAPAAAAAATTATAAAAAAKPAAPSQVPQNVRAQLMAATPLLSSAPQLGNWAAWLAGRFSAFGGTLAAEAASLNGYKQLIDRDTMLLTQQLSAARDRLTTGNDQQLFTRLTAVRSAVYRLAWDVDLGYTNYYGGWPHHRILQVAQALNAANSPKVCYEAGGALYRLASDVDTVYDSAAGLLDTALEVISDVVPGYDGEDGAEVWGSHEVLGAKAELSGVMGIIAAWPTTLPEGDEEDEAVLDEASRSAFGVGYQNLLAAAAG